MKIDNGFKFGHNCISLIYNDLLDLRRRFNRYIKSLRVKQCAELAVYILDQRSLDAQAEIDDLSRAPIQSAHNHVNKNNGKYASEIMILPVSIDITLGMYFGIYLEDLIRKESWFINYRYQDRLPTPSGITKTAWEIRRRHWHNAIPNNRLLTKCGFIMKMDCIEEYNAFSPREILDVVPTYEQRLDSMATSHILKVHKSEWSAHNMYQFLGTKRIKIAIHKYKKIILSKSLKKNIGERDLF